MTEKQLLAKIKKHAAVSDVYSEEGNLEPDMLDWWVDFKPGWHLDECHGLHEQTLAECLEQLANISPCACKDCQASKAR